MPCLVLLVAIVNILGAAGVRLFQNHLDAHAAPAFWVTDLASLTFWMNVLIERDGWFNYPLGVLWSLSVEELFYLSFPPLCLCLKHDARLIGFCGALIVAGPLWRASHPGQLYDYFACFDGIAVGCCTALLTKRTRLPLPVGRAIRLLTPFCLASLYLWQPVGKSNILGMTAMSFGAALLIAAAEDRRSPWAAAAPLRWLGALSYELYLFHLVVLAGLRTAAPPRAAACDAKLLLLAAFFGLSIAFADIVRRRYSEPLNRLIRALVQAGDIDRGVVVSRGR